MPIQQVVSKIKGVADIVFCIDATGSMQPCIDNLKINIETFADSIKNFSPNTIIDWRAKIIAYRDFNTDSEYLVNDMDFVTTPGELKMQLDKIAADGGGDEPESTLDSIIFATLKSNWREESHKAIVVFTDASPITSYHQKTKDEFGIPDGLDILRQILMENRIKLFIYGPQDPTYNEIAKIERVTTVLYDDIKLGLANVDFKSLLDTVGKTVSQIASQGGVM